MGWGKVNLRRKMGYYSRRPRSTAPYTTPVWAPVRHPVWNNPAASWADFVRAMLWGVAGFATAHPFLAAFVGFILIGLLGSLWIPPSAGTN
jgi:hypothetical protein